VASASNGYGSEEFSRFGQFLSQSDPFQSVKAGLTDCMKKESHFQWAEAAQKSFDALKKRIVKAPVLARIWKSSLKWRRMRRVWL
jgi:hypothetical protein